MKSCLYFKKNGINLCYMAKFLVHFPLVITLLVFSLLAWGALWKTPWLFLPLWQTLCLFVMLLKEGPHRIRRFEKSLNLVKAGFPREKLPREGTICGFFIRLALMMEINRSGETG